MLVYQKVKVMFQTTNHLLIPPDEPQVLPDFGKIGRSPIETANLPISKTPRCCSPKDTSKTPSQGGAEASGPPGD